MPFKIQKNKLKFGVFLISAAASVFYFFLMFSDDSMGKMISGLVSIRMAIFGWWSFRTIMEMKGAVSQIIRLNNELAFENDGLKMDMRI